MMVEMEIHQWMIDVEGRLTVWVKTPIEVSKPFTKKEPHSLWGGKQGSHPNRWEPVQSSTH